jgi:hypothetical protein
MMAMGRRSSCPHSHRTPSFISARHGGRGTVSWLRACIAAQGGERDQALELLRVALAHGVGAGDYLHVYAFLEPLHGYPPFEELIEPKG